MSVTTSEQIEIRAMARELARRELMPLAGALDSCEQDAVEKCWSLLAETGLDRALLAERDGGVGLGTSELLAVVEELAVGDGGMAMRVLLSNAALGTLPDGRLAELGEGERWVLVPVRTATELTVSADGRLVGRVQWALGCDGADGVVLAALDGPGPRTWALPTGSIGLKLERDADQLGLRSAPAALLELQNVSGPSPDESGGAIGAMEASSLLYAGTAAVARGIARRARELAYGYAQEREQGGVAIIEHDAVSDMLSAMAVRLRCRPEIFSDAAGGELAWAQALAAKIAATDAAVATTTDAVQVFGGTGYMVETGIEKLMRDAKCCQLFPEPNWVVHGELMRVERQGAGAAVA
jgi:alkylation response protein AidB-like acyl-CoA dehydrogenase